MAKEDSPGNTLYKLVFGGPEGRVEAAEGSQILIAQNEAGKEDIFVMHHI